MSAITWTWVDLERAGVGRALVADGGRGLCLVSLGEGGAKDQLVRWRRRYEPGAELRELAREARREEPGSAAARLLRARRALEAYASGQLRAFELELDLRGSSFELEVWAALGRIPCGQTVTYGELARGLGRAGAARAVGAAAGRNPVPIVVPCHRLVASSGLGGFSAGLERKRALLALERAPVPSVTKSRAQGQLRLGFR